MPVIKSAIKKARQDVKARAHNRVIRDAYKNAAKNVRKLVEAGDTKKAQEALKEAYSKIDIAAKKNVVHKNNAARRKSRLAALLKKDKAPKAEVKKAEEKVAKKTN